MQLQQHQSTFITIQHYSAALHTLLASHVTLWLFATGENIITIVGGANQSEWKFSQDDQKVGKIVMSPMQASLCIESSA